MNWNEINQQLIIKMHAFHGHDESSILWSVQSSYRAILVLLSDRGTWTIPGIPSRLWFKQQVSLTACEMSNLQPLHPCFSALCWGLNGFKSRGKKARWTWGKSGGARNYWEMPESVEGGRSLLLLSTSVEGEALVKHSCLFVWSDQPPCMVGLRLISPSTEQGSKGELTVLRGTSQALSYRVGIDMVPWGPSGAAGGGGWRRWSNVVGWERRGGGEKVDERGWLTKTVCGGDSWWIPGNKSLYQWMRRLVVKWEKSKERSIWTWMLQEHNIAEWKYFKTKKFSCWFFLYVTEILECLVQMAAQTRSACHTQQSVAVSYLLKK